LWSNKKYSRQAQSNINICLGWIASVGKAKSFTSTYYISKDLNITPLTAKCVLAQVKCFKKWENSNCIISYFVNNIIVINITCGLYHAKTFVGKFNTHENDRAIKIFTEKIWKRTQLKPSHMRIIILKKTSEYLKLCYEYPEYSYGFYWLLKARSRYKLDGPGSESC